MSRAIKDIYEDYRVRKEALAPFEKEINEKISVFVKETKKYVRNGYTDPETNVNTRLGTGFGYWDISTLNDAPYYTFYIDDSIVYIENPNDSYGDEFKITFEELDNAETVVLEAVKKFVAQKLYILDYAWEAKKKKLEKDLAKHLESRP